MTNIFIKTFGCSLNNSDSELMAGLLKDAGYNIINNDKNADLIIINSCTVKGIAENKLFHEINRYNKIQNKKIKIIIAGCVPQAEKNYLKTRLKDYSIVGTAKIINIVRVAEETLKGRIVQLVEYEKNPRLNLPKIRKNKIIEIVPINEGCLSECTYCKTVQARGKLNSYNPKEIKKQIENAIRDGCKEIWLTSQDTGVYGFDINTNLAKLLNSILEIKGDYKIRIGMMNPLLLKKFINELINVYKNKNLFKFLHIPVQSGNNRILKLMNRGYTVENFIEIVDSFRKEIPDITISTDIIVGFPTETDDEFMDTCNLIKEIKPSVLNISKFWPRPGTKAAKFKQVNSRIIKDRILKISNLFNNICVENNKKWIGWCGSVIIDEVGKNNTFIGRNDYYKSIILKGNYEIGDCVDVKIVQSSIHDLIAGTEKSQ
ncbi:MAG: tRNA (N(6)-L-threonylcarbamoyladenosine(37)-C(2))-methylthiotransferase [Candidatus Woesearchaeota archaeon]